MIKRMCGISIALLLVIGLAGCGEDTDQDELREAENLVGGINMMAMMVNVDAYSEAYFSDGIQDAPPNWTGPDTFANIPAQWDNDYFYQFVFPFPVDSAGVTIDSGHIYLMFTPDIWDSLYMDSIPTTMDIGLLADVRDIWFHTVVNIPDTESVDGSMRWNWDDTWYDYAYDVSQITEAGQIDITTSTNIGLAAHFLFADDGSGSLEDNYGEWHNTTFVKFEFFPEPDANGYDGFYQLLSEAWKVDHYFRLIDDGSTF